MLHADLCDLLCFFAYELEFNLKEDSLFFLHKAAEFPQMKLWMLKLLSDLSSSTDGSQEN